MTDMQAVQQVVRRMIARYGGVEATAEAVGVSPFAVRDWYHSRVSDLHNKSFRRLYAAADDVERQLLMDQQSKALRHHDCPVLIGTAAEGRTVVSWRGGDGRCDGCGEVVA